MILSGIEVLRVVKQRVLAPHSLVGYSNKCIDSVSAERVDGGLYFRRSVIHGYIEVNSYKLELFW